MLWHRFVRFDGRIGLAAFWGTIGILTIAMQIGIWLANNAPGDLLLFALLVVYPFVVVSMLVKRLHDREKTGWAALLVAIPVIGQVWALIELGLMPGTTGPNKYGAPESGSPFERGDDAGTLAHQAYQGAD